MKKNQNRWLVLICCCTLSILALAGTKNPLQENVMTQTEVEFKMYIDTIDAHLYRSNNVVERTLAKCDSILQNNQSISIDTKVNYYNKKINYNLNHNRPLVAYQIIVDHEFFAQSKAVSEENRNRFSYFNAYTLLILGDLDEAQKIFYSDFESAKIKRDTYSMSSTLYSLGQLYGDKKDYNSAIKCYLEVVALKDKTTKIPSTTIALTDFELAGNYFSLKDWGKADTFAARGLAYARKHKIEFLIPYLLDIKARIALEKNQVKQAEKIANEINILAKAGGDDRTLKTAKNLQAIVYRHSTHYQKAIRLLEELLVETDSIQYGERINIHRQLHEIFDLKGQPANAYDHLLQLNAIQEKKETADNTEKTAYLKIKFETEQQKAENELLASKIKQGNSERNILGLISTMFFLGMIGFFVAFYQKRKYNSTLKKEVGKRTTELKQTNTELTKRNAELDEFNRILAHDLREPLRSIVGFSQMAKASEIDQAKRSEYLTFIEKSGRQLHQIINGISTYRAVGNQTSKPQLVDTDNLVQQIKTTIQPYYPNKNIQISSRTELPEIFIQPKVLKTVLEQLIDNGIKYNENEIAKLGIQYTKIDGKHVFEISDNGIGIAEEYHQKIFDMCKRLHTRDVYEGSGMGLNITQKILEKNNGQIRLLKSTEGKGSTFQIELPYVVSGIHKSVKT